MEPSANTMVVWQPQHIHGTSLQDRNIDGNDPQFSQTGVAIVTSNRLPAIWKKYWANILTQEEAGRELEAGGCDEDNDVDTSMPIGTTCQNCPVCMEESVLSDSY